MKLKAELKVEMKIRKEFEEKIALLEGKLIGMELALTRARKNTSIRNNNNNYDDEEEKAVLTKRRESILNSQGSNNHTKNDGGKDPRHVEVLKQRLKDAMYESEKQRLEVRQKNDELAKAHQIIKNLEHVIDSVKNNHTFKMFSEMKKKGVRYVTKYPTCTISYLHHLLPAPCLWSELPAPYPTCTMFVERITCTVFVE